MKKIFAIVMVVAMLATMAVATFAADEFIDSAENKPSDVIKATKDDGTDVTDEIILVEYNERDILSDEDKADFEKSFDVLQDNKDDLTNLDAKVNDMAEDNKVDAKDLTPSDIFYLDSVNENLIKDGENYTVVLKVDNLDKFAGVMRHKDGKWSVVDGAYVNEDGYLVFATNSLGAYSVISTTAKASAPQTGDAMVVISAAALVAVAGMAVVVIRRRENA